MKMMKQLAFVMTTFTFLLAGCKSDNSTQSENGNYFTVKVGNEQFIMLVSDPVTIQLAIENYQGKNHKFPMGRIAQGDGGFNHPWDWHFVPETVNMVDVAIEVCDGTPSYVNSHPSDYLAVGYCPWAATVVKVGR